MNTFFQKHTETAIHACSQQSCQRRVTRNFLGQESFPGIRALQQTIIYNTKKKGPAGKNFQFFLLETLEKFTINEKFNPQMTAIRAFFPKFGYFFLISRKGQGRTAAFMFFYVHQIQFTESCRRYIYDRLFLEISV